MASGFYKSYQQHLEQRKGFEDMKQRDQEALSQLKSQYRELESKYKNLKSEVEKNAKIGREIAMQTPGAEKLFADGMEGSEDLGQDIIMRKE